MRIIFILLTIVAAFLMILVVGLTVISIAIGGGSILFPGLGVVVSLPLVIVLLAAVDTLIIFLALLFKRMSEQLKIP